MRVAYLFQDQYPWDIRADKITDAFAQAGHTAIIVSRNRTGLSSRERLRNDVQVRRLPACRSKFIRDLVNFPAFFSPVWLWTLYRTVVDEKVDVVIVRDLPMSIAAWLIGRITGRPVILDMAEDYPAMIQDTWDHRGPARFDFLLRNPKFLRAMERWIVPKLDGVLVVSPASKKRVEKFAGNVAVQVIQNTPRLAAMEQLEESELSRAMRGISNPKILYVGGLEEMRGLAVVVEAMPELVREVGPVNLVIVGEGTSKANLQRRVEQLNLGKYVQFPGWLDQRFVPGVIAEADIGIVPHLVTDHTNTTLPNKIYDYMAQAKPVVVTNADSLKEMVETYRCGAWYEHKNFVELARVLQTLISDKQSAAEAGARGRNAVLEELNWSADATQLIRFSARIAGAEV